jgi:NADH dehydrogenase
LIWRRLPALPNHGGTSMSKRIVIVGSGFAGMWAALSAARLQQQHPEKEPLDIVVVAPRPALTMRPRLYESNSSLMSAPLKPLFQAIGARFIRGKVDTIDTVKKRVTVTGLDDVPAPLPYDRLVVASGSHLFRPNIPGLRDHAFSIDQIDDASELEAHCKGLKDLPDHAARNTVVVVGGGFTGIELAAEMPARLRNILGADTPVRVVVVEQADAIGPDLGPGPRPTISKALGELGVECRLGAAVTTVDSDGVTLQTGDRIEALTVVWTAGLRASALTTQIPAARDRLGRLQVDRYLRVPECPDIFAAGDTAYAATDDLGNHALMSCQHAMALGRSAGNNAAADLLGVAPTAYSQPRYVTCLDLGPWGAVLTEGWDRAVQMDGAEAKKLKTYINSELIYPPPADRSEALALADPTRPVVA